MATDIPAPRLQPSTLHLASLLKAHSLTLSTVETACGGLVSSSLLSTPGASKFFRGGVTLYTLPSRIAFGGWTAEMLDTYRGPTKEVVLGLARHNKQVLGADWVIAESGTAGPTRSRSGNNGEPGYLALAVVGPGGWERAVEHQLGSSDRAGNMGEFARLAMEFVAECIEESLKGEGKL
ncbi:competence/damage-inducible protein-like protein cinA [Calocera viscosa TUFC12733]|uniref:Competence/damage-inducible protein-like protein cinA n=1 Tax=Calocera viscosa (strain TUFC12733) TaxID=1330018 RepID=A0A167IHG7_CALVF|nr:competence/damage-inducible protein-like protein cinA [Calocera viscosa TUFC12733]